MVNFVAGFLSAWFLRSLMERRLRQIDRRRGRNPPPPGRKPAPPAGPPDWRRSFTHECINPPTGDPPLKLRRRKPAPSAGPPEQPLAAQLVRYWAWEQEQVRQAWLDPALGEPWPEDCQAAFAAGVAAERDRLRVDSEDWGSEALNAATGAMIEAYRRHTGQPETLIFYNNAKAILRDALGAYLNNGGPIRIDEGPTQRGNGNGGPATPKPPIKPQPHGGRLFINNKPPEEN